MPKFYVMTTVTFCGEVEAADRDEAEQMGWQWEDELHYDGVYSIEVEEMESDEDED